METGSRQYAQALWKVHCANVKKVIVYYIVQHLDNNSSEKQSSLFVGVYY